MGKESEYHSPDKDYCASQKKHFMDTNYIVFAQRLVLLDHWDLTKESVHDIHYLKDVKELLSNCILTGDKELYWKRTSNQFI